MRPNDEIQQVHDLLHAIIEGEVNLSMDEAERLDLAMVMAPLCWALNTADDEDNAFAHLIGKIQRAVAAAGYRPMKLPVPFRGRRPGVDG